MGNTQRAAELLDMADVASGFATMMRGQARRTMRARSKALRKAAMVEAGPLPADIAAMTDGEILAELTT